MQIKKVAIRVWLHVSFRRHRGWVAYTEEGWIGRWSVPKSIGRKLEHYFTEGVVYDEFYRPYLAGVRLEGPFHAPSRHHRRGGYTIVLGAPSKHGFCCAKGKVEDMIVERVGV